MISKLIIFFLQICACLLAGAASERIVTDEVSLRDGVPIDLSYNETISHANPNDTVSAPGCPKSINGKPWVYYGFPDKKCHFAGTNLACAFERSLFFEPGNPNGLCNCDCFAKDNQYNFDFGKMQFCKTNTSEYVFIPEFKNCFTIYDYNPCQLGYWLVKLEGETGPSVRCELRTCPFLSNPVTQSDGSVNCTSFQPAVVQPPFPVSSTSYLNSNRCPSGQKFSQTLKQCIPKSKEGDKLG